MRRFILCGIFAATPFVLQAAVQKKKIPSSPVRDIFTIPTKLNQEIWENRTQLSSGFKKNQNPFWNLQTIQPLYRDAKMAKTVFTQTEFGFQKWAHPTISVGLGFRQIATNNRYMLGSNLFFDHDFSHSMTNMGFGLEMFGKFFTMRLNYNFRVHRHHNLPQPFQRSFDHVDTYGTLNVNFQLPFLPWTTVQIGPKWTFKRMNTKPQHDWRYALRMNLAGPVALETGFAKGIRKGGYICLSVNFGRPCVVEHSLLDNGIFATEAFTARNLKNYTLEPVSRFGYVR